MSCWQILGIDEQSDITAIKEAYSKKIKISKPDTHPKEFGEINAAYRQALKVLKYRNSNLNVPSQCNVQSGEVKNIAIVGNDNKSINDFVKKTESTDSVEPEITSYDEMQKAWDDLTHKTNTLLESKKNFNDIESWKFISDCDCFYDLAFKAQFSNFLFEKIIEHNRGKKKNISKDILIYLNKIFMWSEKRNLLERDFGANDVDNIIKIINKKSKWKLSNLVRPKIFEINRPNGSFGIRFFALIIDLLVLAVILSPVVAIRDYIALADYNIRNFSFFLLTVYTLLGYFIVSPIFEASPFQATPGKIVFDLFVISKNGKRLNIIHSLWRSFSFLIFIFGIKANVWVNLLFKEDGLSLHDWMSGSRVIKSR